MERRRVREVWNGVGMAGENGENGEKKENDSVISNKKIGDEGWKTDKKKTSGGEASYDNAPETAYIYEIVGEEAIVTSFTAKNTIANVPRKLGGKPVTTIGSKAFAFCENLETVNLPETVTTIESRAFAGCMSLQTVSFSISLESIGEEAFYGCSVLNILNFPPELQRIGSRAFAYCTSLELIAFSEGDVEIAEDAFDGTPWSAMQ